MIYFPLASSDLPALPSLHICLQQILRLENEKPSAASGEKKKRKLPQRVQPSNLTLWSQKNNYPRALVLKGKKPLETQNVNLVK